MEQTIAEVVETEPGVVSPEVAPEAPNTPATPPEPKPDTTVSVEPEKATTSSFEAVTEPIIVEGLKYGDMEVNVEIPVEVANLAGEKGLDVQAMSKELYESEDFTLSQESLDALKEAGIAQWQVEAYLSGIKAKNDAIINGYKQEVETKTANEQKAWEATLEVMGGEDRWNDMAAYATETLEDDELDEFNEVMEKGTLRMQQLMIKDLYNRFSQAGAPKAPVVLDLEEGATGGDPSKGSEALSAAQYLELLRTGEYKKDPDKYDYLRRLGLSKGL